MAIRHELHAIGGIERAAILLLSIGEQGASEVLRHMSPGDVQKVSMAMAALGDVSNEQVSFVLEDFVDTVEHEIPIGGGSDEYVCNVIEAALGPDRADNLIERILPARRSKGLETLKWMDPRQVADLIQSEHPQILAIILSCLGEEHASAVLSHFPEQLQSDVVMRIASLEGVRPSVLHELDDVLARQLAGVNVGNMSFAEVGGVKTAANILNHLNGGQNNAILEQVRERDEELGQTIQESMFTFEDLLDIEDRGIQGILRELTNETLITALKGADDRVRRKIYKNVSKRAAEMLREDLEARGPVRVNIVKHAQAEIIAVARRLADAGEIALKGRDDGYVI